MKALRACFFGWILCAALASPSLAAAQTPTADPTADGRPPKAGASPADPLVRARQLYNDGEYDEAIAAARAAAARPGPQSEASLLLGRALLERHRQSHGAEDLDAARQALRRVDAASLTDRGRLDLLVGLGEALYLDDEYRPATALLDSSLDQVALLAPAAREQVADWWATSMDRYAQTRPPDERIDVYLQIESRLRTHLGRYPDSSAAPYWAAAASLARGDVELAWDLALAGWVRSPLAPDGGEALRADLDRLVTQGIIPERVKRLPGTPDEPEVTAGMLATWETVKANWAVTPSPRSTSGPPPRPQ